MLVVVVISNARVDISSWCASDCFDSVSIPTEDVIHVNEGRVKVTEGRANMCDMCSSYGLFGFFVLFSHMSQII